MEEGVKPLDGDGEEGQVTLPPTQTLPLSLDAQGTARQAIEVPQAIDTQTDMLVEMDYEDANGEVLTASKRITLYPAAVQLGIRTDGWLMKDDDLRLQLAALDTAGLPIKGQRIQVALYSREILTARRRLIGGFYAYDNRMRTTKIDADCSATTDAQGFAACKLDPGVSGEVYAVATTTDADGNMRARDHVGLAGRRRRMVVRRRQWRPDGPDPRKARLQGGRDRALPGAHAVPRGDRFGHHRARGRARQLRHRRSRATIR